MADVQYKRRIGDRRDGRQIRSADALFRISPFISRQRGASVDSFTGSVEVSETERWLRERRAEGYRGMGMLHLFIAAYIRALSLRPALNRFISGQRLFARHNIEIILPVRRTPSPDSPTVTVKMIFDPSDTVFDVYRKLGARVDEIMADTNETDAERVAGNLIRLPRIFLRWMIGILKLLDYYGWLPQALTDASPWHGSLSLCDLGASGLPPFGMHLNNFGNLPLQLSFGAKRQAIEVEGSGRAAQHEYVDYSVTMDSRVCDSLVYASAFRGMSRLLSDPRLLEKAPERIAEDIF